MLRLAPGLWASRHGTEGKALQIFLRGVDAAHGADLELLVEGIPVNEPSNLHGQGYLDLGFLVPEAVDRLIVTKGPFEARQGNFATAGTVDIRLGRPEGEPDTWLSYLVGSTWRHRLMARHGTDHGVFAAEAVSDAGYGVNRGSRRAATVGRWRLLSGRAGTLEVLGWVQAAAFGEAGVLPVNDVADGRQDFYGSWTPYGRGSSQRAVLGLRHAVQVASFNVETTVFGQGRRLELVENFTGHLLSEEHGDTRRQRQESLGFGARLQAERRFGTLRWTGGASWLTDDADREETRVDERLVPWETTLSDQVVHHALGVWTSVRARPVPWFWVEGGGRSDLLLINGVSFLQLSPRITAAVRVPAGLSVFGAFGRGLRAPDVRTVGAGSARMTSSDSAETGIRANLGEDFDAELAGFGTWIGREQVFDHLSGTNLEQGATRRYGVELGVAYRPSGWSELRADGTLVDARFTDTGEPIPGVPRALGTFSASAVHPVGLRGQARILALGTRPLAHGAEAAAFAVVDASIAYRWSVFELGLQVENLLDSRYREGEYHYASWFDRSVPRSALPALHYTPGAPRNVRFAVSLLL